MLLSRYDRVLALVAISHLKHAMEHFSIQPYAEHAGIMQYFFLSVNSLNNVLGHSRW